MIWFLVKVFPEISDLPPLTWYEVVLASRTFQEHYTNNEITKYSEDTRYSKKNRPKLNDLEKPKFYREHPEEKTIRYLWFGLPKIYGGQKVSKSTRTSYY